MSLEWRAPDLGGRVAVVAGGSRGVGRGIAEVLGACGAFVYVTGRSTRARPWVDPDRTVEAVVETIRGSGGSAEAVVCDHKIDRDVELLFERVSRQHGGIDILVNNQIGWSDNPSGEGGKRRRLWQRPITWWDDNFDAGVRGHVVNCHYGIPLMLERAQSIVLFTSERAARNAAEAWDAVFDLRATVALRMVELLANQLRSKNVPAVLLYPGWTRTEHQVDGFKDGGVHPTAGTWEQYVSKTASPHYAGRAVAMLSADPKAMELTGTLQTSHDLATRYGFTDIDGSRPNPT